MLVVPAVSVVHPAVVLEGHPELVVVVTLEMELIPPVLLLLEQMAQTVTPAPVRHLVIQVVVVLMGILELPVIFLQVLMVMLAPLVILVTTELELILAALALLATQVILVHQVVLLQ